MIMKKFDTCHSENCQEYALYSQKTCALQCSNFHQYTISIRKMLEELRKIDSINLSGLTLDGIDMSQYQITGCRLSNIKLLNANLDGAKFSHTFLDFTTIANCSFQGIESINSIF